MEVAKEADWVTEVVRRHYENRGVAITDLQVQPFVVAGSILSTLYMAEMKEVDTGRRLSLACKLLERKLMLVGKAMVMHYLNERLFYDELLPFLMEICHGEHTTRLVPKFHFAHHDDFQYLIALDNMQPLGYKTAQSLLDLKHATESLRALGRFHALSYVAKKNEPKEFHAFMKRLGYPRKEGVINRIMVMVTLNSIRHTIKLFREARPAEYAKYSKQIEELLTDASELYGGVYDGREPMAVLCHGDFKSENMMFTYDSDSNVLAVKLIDFQLISYSSPAIDVFLLIFLSTPPEIWRAHWNTLLGSYHDALLQTVSGCLTCPLKSLQGELRLEAFKKEFKDYCHHGFYIANFFHPLRNLKQDQYVEIMTALFEDSDSPEKIDPLFVKMNNSYSEEMKNYVIGMLEKILELKVSS